MRPGVSSRVVGLLLRWWTVHVDGDCLDPRRFAVGVVDGMRRGLAILVAVCVLLWASEHADAMLIGRDDGEPVVTPSAVVAAATTAEKQENPSIEDNGETNQDAQRVRTMRAQAVNKHAVNEPNAQAKSSTNQTSTQVFASSVVLVGGAVIIAIVAMAFKHTQKTDMKRDENDPMQQSLLCHDMDYAAM